VARKVAAFGNLTPNFQDSAMLEAMASREGGKSPSVLAK